MVVPLLPFQTQYLVQRVFQGPFVWRWASSPNSLIGRIKQPKNQNITSLKTAGKWTISNRCSLCLPHVIKVSAVGKRCRISAMEKAQWGTSGCLNFPSQFLLDVCPWIHNVVFTCPYLLLRGSSPYGDLALPATLHEEPHLAALMRLLQMMVLNVCKLPIWRCCLSAVCCLLACFALDPHLKGHSVLS